MSDTRFYQKHAGRWWLREGKKWLAPLEDERLAGRLDRTTAGVEEARSILHAWLSKQGHERCWYYPELFHRLCAALAVQYDGERALPAREEFEDGCRRYQQEQYDEAK